LLRDPPQKIGGDVGTPVTTTTTTTTKETYYQMDAMNPRA
jgi:hypothetical protein